MSVDPPRRSPTPPAPDSAPESSRSPATDARHGSSRSDGGDPQADRDLEGPLPDLAATARIQLLVEQIEDFAIFTLTPDGRHATWNAGVERVLGYDEDAFLGRSCEIIFTPEDAARGVPAAELAEARARGRASNDRWMRRRDGSRFWASGVTTSLWDDAGRLLGFGKVLRDLTSQRLLLERLAESDERLRMATSAAKVGTWRWDLRTGTDTLDATLAGLLELGEGDTVVTLEQFFERVHPDDRERTRAAFMDAVARRAELRVEFRVTCRDGSVRWLRDHGEVLLDEAGEPRYLTGAVVDITEQREADERLRASQRMDAVGKLAGGVAHEVNNMMSVVLGFTEFVLADFPPGDRRRHDLEQVRTAAGRAATVTAQLLAFSRRQIMQPVVLRLDEVVATLEPVLRRLLGADRRLVVRAAPEAGHVRADPGQLEQVIINLALNARDAMGQNGRLTIEIAPVVREPATAEHPDAGGPMGPCVLLTISDTGHGMDEATQARAFEPFFTTRPVGRGTGLAVVHGIVHQSGGHIEVESAPGAGTTFRIWLPAVAATGARPARPPAAAATGAHETILVVEDEPMVRELVVRMLEQLGYCCLEASDGDDALRVVEAHAGAVDGVVTDLVMPRMNGRALAERLKERRPELPVLFMSGYTDDEMIRRDLLVAGAPFIQKPFEAEALAASLASVLSGAKA